MPPSYSTVCLKRPLTMANLKLDVGFYDPLSVFQGGFQQDFVARSELPQLSLKLPFNPAPLQVNNVGLRFIEEVPASCTNTQPYLKFVFVVTQNVDDYRSTARPLIKQWLNSVSGLQPAIPLFIILFEQTQSKMATDKLLKTSIEGKLKKDFPQTDFPNLNIFRVKSIYPSNDEKLAAWSHIKECIKVSLSQSISNKFNMFTEDERSRARVFTDLEMYSQASSCYETLFDKIVYVGFAEGFSDFDLSNVNSIFDPVSLKDVYETKFDEKLAYLKYQAFILLSPKLPQKQINANIKKLVKLLLSFINSLEMCGKRFEFAWLIIREFLNLEIVKSLPEQPTDVQSEVQISLNSLMLAQRNELLKLGHIQGYHIQGAFIDVPVSDQKYDIESQTLLPLFESFKVFSEDILKQSKQIITRYKQFNQNKHSVASLEAETALILHYNANVLDEYSDDEILKYLYDAFQHFSKNGWDNISLPLLDVYIKQLEQKVSNGHNSKENTLTTEKVLASYMKLISLKPITFDQSRLNGYLNLYFDSKETESNLTLNIPSLLQIAEVSPLYCSDVDTFALDITLNSPVDGMEVNDIVIELSAADDSDTILYFSWTGKTGKLGPRCKFPVTSHIFVKGLYRVTNVFATVGSRNKNEVIISHEYDTSIAKEVFIYNIPKFCINGSATNNTTAVVSVPSLRWLHRDELEFNVKLGDVKSEAQDCIFTFFKVEPDRVVPNAKYHLYWGQKEISFTFEEDDEKLTFKTGDQKFVKGDELTLKLPFFFPADITNTKLELYYSFNYTPNIDNAQSVMQYQTLQLSTQLRLAAAADEKVKYQSLISYYKINSVSPSLPMCIRAVSLAAESSVIEKSRIPDDVIVFMDQGSTFFFKITDLKDKKVDLKIEYTCLWKEILKFVQDSFNKRVLASEETSDLLKYSSIVSGIWEECQFKVNYYALTGRICVNNFDIAKFTTNLENVCEGDSKRLIAEITSHVNSLEELSKNASKQQCAEIRESLTEVLWIPVQLPSIDVIGTVQYHYQEALQYMIGEPIQIKMQLCVNSFTTETSASPTIPECLEDEFERKVRFDDSESSAGNSSTIPLAVEIVEDDQNWIVAGVKDLTVEIEQTKGYSKEFNFDLIFIPIKTGKLELPNVNIRLPTSSKLSLHLDFKNKSEVLSVVSELNTVTQLH